MVKLKRNILLIAASEHDSDMLFASGFMAPDPFGLVVMQGITYLLASPLEYERACKESKADEVINTAEIKVKGLQRSLARTILAWLTGFRIKSFEVPGNFPLAAADFMRKAGLKLKTAANPFFPERMVKSQTDIKKVKKICRSTEKALKAVEYTLARSKIGFRDYIILDGKRLTSEKLKGIINMELARENAIASGVIAAGGDQACDPHCSGKGPLRAYQPIIVDIFPRSQETGFYGDITRTFIKGKPSAALQKIYSAVKAAQQLGISLIKPRAGAARVHKAVANLLKSRGFETCLTSGSMRGFIHSTGHGLGLDIHEAPGVSAASRHIFKTGNIVTVEPGLYYPGIGAVRIEDDVAVRPGGCEILTRYHKRFIIS